MRSHFHSWLSCLSRLFLGALVGSFSAATLLAATPSSATRSLSELDPVQELVREALQAEAEGDLARRTELLSSALELAPDDASVHWHLGQVQVDGQWRNIEEASTDAALTDRVRRHQELRDQTAATPDGQLALARWCNQQGLSAQEKAHLIFTLQMQPNTREAIKRLDLVNYHGTLLPRSQVDQRREQAGASSKTQSEWKSRLRKFSLDARSRNETKRKEALEALSKIDDPAAIPMMERVFASASGEAAEAVITSLAGMPQQAAVDSLMRFAVFAQDGKVRKAAAQALGRRSVFSYVPTLVAGLKSPIEIQFSTFLFNGQPGHALSLFEAGAMYDQSFYSSGAASRHIHSHDHVSLDGSQVARASNITYFADATFAEDLSLARQAQAANAARHQYNDRLIAALRRATAAKLDDNPIAWQNWWYDYNGYYRPPENSVIESTRYAYRSPSYSYSSSQDQPAPPPRPPRACECFVAGTKVWTMTGTKSIERIRPGDCVLAQDPESGELAYQPVLDTTIRPASPTLNVRTAAGLIRATTGHPFWVSGIGWQMTKELQAGQWLHGTEGPVRIEEISEGPEDVCYNLIVADFNTYFIGDDRILVHDNNLREVTTATVPGLVAE